MGVHLHTPPWGAGAPLVAPVAGVVRRVRMAGRAAAGGRDSPRTPGVGRTDYCCKVVALLRMEAARSGAVLLPGGTAGWRGVGEGGWSEEFALVASCPYPFAKNVI